MTNRFGVTSLFFCLTVLVSVLPALYDTQASQSLDLKEDGASVPLNAGTLAVPRQALISDWQAAADELAAGEAEKEYYRALAALRTNTESEAASQGALDILRSTFKRWPNTPGGYLAYVLALDLASAAERDLEDYEMIGLGFVDESMKTPSIYFSEGNAITTSRLVARVIGRLADSGRADEAWISCIRMRWMSPRINDLAPACSHVVAAYPRVLLSAEASLDLLPMFVKRTEITVHTGEDMQALRNYISNPYSEVAFEQAVRVIAVNGQASFAKSIIPELLGLNVEALWRTDVPRLKTLYVCEEGCRGKS